MVRVLARRPDMIGQALDFGADGVLVPGIRTVDEAQTAIRAAHFAPEGERGLAFSSRAAGYGYHGGADFLEAANRHVAVLLQIETREAVDCLEDIVQLSGFDGVFVGPTDLSVAYGDQSRQTDRVIAVIQQIREVAERAGKPWGLFTGTIEGHRSWREQGSWYCATGVPNLMRTALASWLDREPAQ
jgi:4-hydroxy-2-oxoheptanedioate aldolase